MLNIGKTMTTVGDIYEADLAGTIIGKPMHNIFWYKLLAVGSGSAANGLGQAIDTTILAILAVQMSNAALYNTVSVKNLSDPTDYDVYNVTANPAGHVTGDCLPPTNCYSFDLPTVLSTRRRGHKRFAGVAESQQTDGVTNPDNIIPLGLVAATLSEILIDTDGNEFQPVIRHVVSHGPPKVYDYNDVVSAHYVKISTQNSRKF